MEDNFKNFFSNPESEYAVPLDPANASAPVWAYYLLAEATQHSKKTGLQIIKYVTDRFCNSEVFDWGVWLLSCNVMEMLVIESR